MTTHQSDRDKVSTEGPASKVTPVYVKFTKVNSSVEQCVSQRVDQGFLFSFFSILFPIPPSTGEQRFLLTLGIRVYYNLEITIMT